MYHLSFLKRAANAQEMEKKDLLSELEVMKTLKPHPHVIKLLGCVTISGNSDLYTSSIIVEMFTFTMLTPSTKIK